MLPPYVTEGYRIAGERIPGQNYLAPFTPKLVDWLQSLVFSGIPNDKKVKKIIEVMSRFKFIDVGMGSNIYVMRHPGYPGVVFKFALDNGGLADNFLDEKWEKLINEEMDRCGMKPRYNTVYAVHPTQVVSVQEYLVQPRGYRDLQPYLKSIRETLKWLSGSWLVADLSPTEYWRNYGITRTGDWMWCDASDITPAPGGVRCPAPKWKKGRENGECGARLVYEDDYAHLRCPKCGAYFAVSITLRTIRKEDILRMNDVGFSREQAEKLRSTELAAIMRRGRQKSGQSGYGAFVPPVAMKQFGNQTVNVGVHTFKINQPTNPAPVIADEEEDNDDEFVNLIPGGDDTEEDENEEHEADEDTTQDEDEDEEENDDSAVTAAPAIAQLDSLVALVNKLGYDPETKVDIIVPEEEGDFITINTITKKDGEKPELFVMLENDGFSTTDSEADIAEFIKSSLIPVNIMRVDTNRVMVHQLPETVIAGILAQVITKMVASDEGNKSSKEEEE